MVRTQIQLTEDQSTRLRELAEKRGVSVAKLIREAVDRILLESTGPSLDERWERALNFVGRFTAGVTDLSENHDKYLAEAYSHEGTG